MNEDAVQISTSIRHGRLELNPQQGKAHVDGQEIPLTATEFAILRHLAENPNTTITYDSIIHAVWGRGWKDAKANLQVMVSNIRGKLKEHASDIITTQRGIGYQLTPQGRSANAPSGTRTTVPDMERRRQAGDPGNAVPGIYLGLDGETSSANIHAGGKLIQAGAALWTQGPGGPIEIFSSLIRHDSLDWDPLSQAVHGIKPSELQAAPLPHEVDDALHDWLVQRGADPDAADLIPVGFNVTSYDIPFFAQTLPRSSLLIARRGVDLNSICFAYSGWDPDPARKDNPRTFHEWKDGAKAHANRRLANAGIPENEHDAGYDAAQALLAFWHLKQHLRAVP